MFNLFKKKNKSDTPAISDDEIVAIADGKLFDLSQVKDKMFAQKVMGDGVAFQFSGDEVTLCSPANGVLSALFPTGHAFGVTMKNGTELLVHCGIDTVDAKGDGFTLLSKKQGDTVKAGDPIVKVDLKKVGKKYDMSTMLICTNGDEHPLTFSKPKIVSLGESIVDNHNN